MKLSNYIKGFLAMVVATLGFSLIGTLGSLIYKGGANPLTLLTGRFFIAGSLFLITILFWNRNLFKVKKEDIKWIALSSGILVLHLILYWYGFKLVKQVSIQLALFFLFPLWIVLIKKRINKRIISCLILGMTGVLLVLKIIPNFVPAASSMGILISAVSSVFWALYLISNQKLLEKYHPFTILFYNFAVVFLASIILQNPMTSLSQITPRVAWYLLALGILATYVAYIFVQYSLKFNQARNVGFHQMFTLIFSVILAFVVLNQGMTILQIGGISLIIANVYLLKEKNG